MNPTKIVSDVEIGKRSSLLIKELVEKFPGLLDGNTCINGGDLVEYLSGRLGLWDPPQNLHERESMLTRLDDLKEFISEEVNHGSYKLYWTTEGFFNACVKVFFARKG